MGGIKGFDGAGNPVEAPDAATADAMFERGELGFERGKTVPVRAPDGSIWDLPAENYAKARRAGARLVSEEEIRAEKMAKEAESQGPLVAAARSAAGTVINPILAVGANLSPSAENREATRDVLRGIKAKEDAAAEAYPVASGVATVASYVAPALLTGGASLGARAATAGAAEGAAQVTARGLAAASLQRGTVPGIVNAAGVTAENLAIRYAARMGASEGAKKVIGLAAQGAAEGVVASAADAAVDATINDPDKVAESIVMSAGPGMLMGAAGNVAFGLVGRAIAKGASATKEQVRGLARRLVSDSAEAGAVPPAAQGAAESAVARFLGEAPEPKAGPAAKGIASAFNVDEADAARMFSREGADALDNPEKWLERSTEKVTKSLDEIVESAEELDDELFKGAGKLETIKRVSGGKIDTGRAFDSATAMFAEARTRIDELAANAGEFEKYGALNKLRKELASGEWDDRLMKAAASDDAGAAIAFEMDNLKRVIGYAAKVKPGDMGSVQNLKRDVAGVYEGLRRYLEADDVFGDFAQVQRDVNAGWTKSLRQSFKYNKAFRERLGSQDFEILRKHAPKKIKAWLENAGEFENSLEDEALAELLEGSRERAEVYQRILGGGDNRATKLVKGIDGFRDTWRAVTEQNQTRMAAKKISDQAKSRAIFGSAAVAGLGMVAGASGGESLTGAGIAGAAIANPAAAARALAAIRSTVGKRSSAILGAAGGVSNRARGVAAKVGKPALNAARGAVLFQAYRDAVREVSRPDDGLAAPPDLDVIRPGLGQAVLQKRAAAKDYLKSKLPSGAIGQGMFGHLEAPKVTEYQQRTFMEYVRGATDPLSVLEDVKNGTATFEAVDAVRAVYPRTFAEIQQVVSEQLAGLKEPPPYQSRLELYRVFGVASDPSLSPEFFATMAAIRGQEPEAPQAQTVGAASSERSRMLLSDTARTLSR